MDTYLWKDEKGITHVINRCRIQGSGHDWEAREKEILRLAQRVLELERSLSQEVLNQRIAELKKALAAEESKGRQYCLELAEKAEEIRALRKLADDRLAVMKRLRAAVDEALVHVEQAREESIDLESDEPGCTLITQQLDLAREALAAGKDRTRTAAKLAEGVDPGTVRTVYVVDLAAGTPALRDRVEKLEESLGHLAAATNPSGHQPTSTRLEALEVVQGNHARTLNAILNRLAILEGKA